MKKRLLLSTFLMFIAGALLHAPTVCADPLHEPYETGPYAIGNTSFTVIDPSGRLDISGKPYKLLVQAFYPVDANNVYGPEAVYDFDVGTFVSSTAIELAGFPRTLSNPPVSYNGPFPVVIMGGGDAGMRTYDSVYTNMTLASHGFIVLAPARTGSTSLKIIMLDRLKDVSVLIDAMQSKNIDVNNLFYNAINTQAIGVGGWSMGGFVAYGIAGGYKDKFDANSSYDPNNAADEARETIMPDARVKAIIALDGASGIFPTGPTSSPYNEVLTNAELAAIKIPTLIMGQHHAVIGDLYNLRPHAQISAKANYLVEIKGSRHGSFGSITCGSILVLKANPDADAQLGAPYGTLLSNIMLLQDPECGTAPDPIQTDVNYIGGRENIRLLNLYMVSFLKQHLGGDKRYNRYLNNGYAVSNKLAVDFKKGTQD